MSEDTEELTPHIKGSMLYVEKDAALIAGMDKYAEIAGIGGHSKYIWQDTSKNPDITDMDRKYIKKTFKLSDENQFGYLYAGFNSALVSRKFMALTGAFLRNYRDAFYCPMSLYVPMLMEGEGTDHSVTLIPDFVSSIYGKKEKRLEKVAGWKRELVLSHLMQKQALNSPMILAVPDTDDIVDMYGPAVSEFVQGNYTVIKSKD